MNEWESSKRSLNLESALNAVQKKKKQTLGIMNFSL